MHLSLIKCIISLLCFDHVLSISTYANIVYSAFRYYREWGRTVHGNWKWEFDRNVNDVKHNWKWECRYGNGREINGNSKPIPAYLLSRRYAMRTTACQNVGQGNPY